MVNIFLEASSRTFGLYWPIRCFFSKILMTNKTTKVSFNKKSSLQLDHNFQLTMGKFLLMLLSDRDHIVFRWHNAPILAWRPGSFAICLVCTERDNRLCIGFFFYRDLTLRNSTFSIVEDLRMWSAHIVQMKARSPDLRFIPCILNGTLRFALGDHFIVIFPCEAHWRSMSAPLPCSDEVWD